ncbi:uncharacterized protein LOC115451994 isoform X2 [Manduca sexta]|uniref:uncharacterized protein LOC115451994 isoform X2 n=1 Tax=Manduca sexta TaxID=7130 RepID=UPI001890A825|nr:uncharacterized protein LOC115451994 isoform X2 [Manduca sexta]
MVRVIVCHVRKMESFDTETFIVAIQNRPIIWDSRLPEYSNKVAKRKAWEEINEIINSEFGEQTNEEKNACVVELQKKWKSIKDSYNREWLKEKNCPSGSGAKPRKQYVYYTLLSFLPPLTEMRPPSLSTNTEEYASEGYLETFGIPKSKKPKSNDGVDDAQKKLYEVLTEKSKNFTPSIEHPDQHFFLFLFSLFNCIKEEYKLDAQADMINLLCKYNSMVPTSASTSHYGHQSGYQSYNTTPAGTSTESRVSQLLNMYLTPPTASRANANTADCRHFCTVTELRQKRDCIAFASRLNRGLWARAHSLRPHRDFNARKHRYYIAAQRRRGYAAACQLSVLVQSAVVARCGDLATSQQRCYRSLPRHTQIPCQEERWLLPRRRKERHQAVPHARAVPPRATAALVRELRVRHRRVPARRRGRHQEPQVPVRRDGLPSAHLHKPHAERDE